MKTILLAASPLLVLVVVSACSDDSFVATNEAIGGKAGAASGGGGSGGSSGDGGSGGDAGSSGGVSGSSGSAGQSGAAGAGGGSSECTPGDKQDVGACEKCGTSRRTCNENGNWGAPACESQGVCTPGEKAGGCGDPCEEKVCNDSCAWGGCGKKSGATCLYQSGSNFQCCGADHWQFCNKDTCDWYACQPCQAGSSCLSAC